MDGNELWQCRKYMIGFQRTAVIHCRPIAGLRRRSVY